MDEASVKENSESLSSPNCQPTNGSTKEIPRPKPAATVISDSRLKQLEEQHFIYKVKPKELGNPMFYCRVCNVTFESLSEDKLRQHVSGKPHRKNVKIKGAMLTMKTIPNPSSSQIKALEAMLDSVAKQHALDPDTDLPVRQQVAEEMLQVIQSKIPDTNLYLYGSSLTCFGFKSSDVNLDLSLPTEDKTKVPETLISIKELLLTNDLCKDVKDEFDLTIPQISFIHKKTGLTCHLCCAGELVCKTSKLLNCYAEINPVVRKLVWGLRFWAQSCSIDNKTDGGLVPYCLALMVIQFLQITTPPILPMLDPKKESWKQKYNSKNTAPLGLLWFKLFRFYCIEFPLDENIISIRVKQPYNREERRWGRRRFAIEDPYITNHNVSTVNSDRVFEYIMNCMNASFVYFGTIPKAGQKVSLTSKAARTTTPPSYQSTVVKGSTNDENDGIETYEERGSESEDDAKTQKQTDKTPQPKKQDEDDTQFQMDDLEDDSSSDHSQESKQNLKHIENKLHHLNICATTVNTSSKPNSLPSNNENELEIVYDFKQNILSGGRRPEVQCQCCKKDEHKTAVCPELRKPVLRPLPPLNPACVELISRVCAQTRGELAFAPHEIKFRESVLWNLEDYIQEVFPDSRLHLFGSSMNGFGFRDSDIDICMTLDGKNKEDIDCITIIKDLAKKLKQHRDCANVVAITTAKVPIVKFYLRSVKREADISLYNVLALENTKMLATYAKLDVRVSILGYTLKLFAKLCDIGDASKGSLSSYAYILMLLHYLQKRNPPVIPVLQELYKGDTQPEKIIDNWNCWFYGDLANLPKVWTSLNTESVGSLWIGFLRYYTEVFDWEHNVVSCRRTKKLSKFEKMWTRHIFAIEDPFNLDHNLGAGISRRMGNFITIALTRGRLLFGFPPPMPLTIPIGKYYFNVDFLTDGMEAPSDRTCRVCGHIGHIARECPRLKRNRREERFDSAQRSRLYNRPFAALNTTPRKRAVTLPVQSPSKEPLYDVRQELRVGSLPNKSMLMADKQDGNVTRTTGTPHESHPKTVLVLGGDRQDQTQPAPVLTEPHSITETKRVGQESCNPVMTTHTSYNRTQDQPLPPGHGSPKPSISEHTFGLINAPNKLMSPDHFVAPSPRPLYIQATRSPLQPVSSPLAGYPLVQAQPLHTPPRIHPDGSPWNHPWAAVSPPVEAYHYQQTGNKASDEPRARHRSVSESMVSSGNPPVMIPFGSPPRVFRGDVPFAFAPGTVAPGAVNVPGYPHHTGSPIMHPSSLPSHLQMPIRNVEQQQHLTQSHSQPRPNMPTTLGSHMTGEQFFKIFREAESKGNNSSSKDHNFTSRMIPSSDVVLSHPVVKPILNSPKTEEEHKLFSKLDKVRSLWGSSGETHVPAKNIEALPVQKVELPDNKDVESPGRGAVFGLADISQDNKSENAEREKQESQAKETIPQHSIEKETPGVQTSQSSHGNNGTQLSTMSGKGVLGEKPKDAVAKPDDSPIFDLKSFQKAFHLELVDNKANDASPAQNRNKKQNERKQETRQDPKHTPKSNEKSKEETSTTKRKVSKKEFYEGLEAPPKRQKSKHFKNEDQVDDKQMKGGGESRGNRKTSHDSSSTNVGDMKTPNDKTSGGAAPNAKGGGGTPQSAKVGSGTPQSAKGGGGAPQSAKGGRNTPTKGKNSGGRSAAQGSTPSRGKGGGGPPSRGKGKGASPASAKSGAGAASGDKGSGGAFVSPKGNSNGSTSASSIASASTPSRKGSGGSDKGSGATAIPKGSVGGAVANPKGSTTATPSGKGSGGSTSHSKKSDRNISQKNSKTELFPTNNTELRSSPTVAKTQDSESPSKSPSVVNVDGTSSRGNGEGIVAQPAEDHKERKRRRNKNRSRGRGKGRGSSNPDQS